VVVICRHIQKLEGWVALRRHDQMVHVRTRVHQALGPGRAIPCVGVPPRAAGAAPLPHPPAQGTEAQAAAHPASQLGLVPGAASSDWTRSQAQLCLKAQGARTEAQLGRQDKPV
jgi:hypothetical protein